MRKTLTPRLINSELVANSYDAVADKYDTFYSGDRYKAEDVGAYKVLQEWLSSMSSTEDSSPKKTILDVGCGTANAWDYIGQALSRHDYLGVDISSHMIAHATKKVATLLSSVPSTEDRGHWRFNHQDVRGVKGNYDYIMSMYGGFSYMSVTDMAIQVSRLLKPTGRYCIMLYGQGYHPHDNIVSKESSLMVQASAEEGTDAFNTVAPTLRPEKILGLHTDWSQEPPKLLISESTNLFAPFLICLGGQK